MCYICVVPNWDLKPSGNRSQVQQPGDDKPADSVNRALLGVPFVFYTSESFYALSVTPSVSNIGKFAPTFTGES